MTFPQSIQATVSPATIYKVGRLFNGSAADVLNELLQNARRAGASRVDVDVLDLAGHPTLAVRDDGRGIDDPRMLLTLGQSAWSQTLRAREGSGWHGRLLDGGSAGRISLLFALGGTGMARGYSHPWGKGPQAMNDSDEMDTETRAALAWVYKLASADTGQARRAADFLIAWWNA